MTDTLTDRRQAFLRQLRYIQSLGERLRNSRDADQAVALARQLRAAVDELERLAGTADW